VKDLIEELLAEGTVHALSGAASVTPAARSKPLAAHPVARKVRQPQAQSPLPTAPGAAAATGAAPAAAAASAAASASAAAPAAAAETEKDPSIRWRTGTSAT